MEEELTAHTVAVEERVQDALISLDSAGLTEIACAFALPLLALLIGISINRWFGRRPNHSFFERALDWIGPLVAPMLAILFVMGAGYTLRAMQTELFILPFVWKLAVAWFAIQLVSMVSSRQGTGWIVILVIAPITLMHLFGVWEPVVNTLNDMEFSVSGSKFTAYGVLQSAAVVIALFWVAGFLVSATDNRLRRIRTMHVSNRVLVMKIFQIVLYFVVFLIGLQVVGISLTALSVFGGALGVGIGFGLQKIASNFISGIILLFEKSVSVDDMIQLADGTTGFIRANAARYTLIEVGDGREMMIPNEEFITQRVTTLTHSNRRARVDIPVGIGYGSDVPKAIELLKQAVANCKGCLQDPAPAAWAMGFGDSAINMQLSFWVNDVTEGRNTPRSNVMIEILRLFKQHGIDIPYPHQVQLNAPEEEQPPKPKPARTTTAKKEKKA